MQLVIDENEQEHIYICLKEGAKAFAKQKKAADALELPTEPIEEQLEINRKLRRELNPRAEDEAREASRKRDPAQMDIEEVESSGETGGATRVSLEGPGRMAPAELRDALFAAGLVVAMTDVGEWENAEVDAVSEWLGRVVAAQNGAGTIPDEPECLVEARPMSVARFEELLAAGPFIVREAHTENEQNWEVVETTDPENPVKTESFDDRRDAELYAADENLYAIRNADLPGEEVDKWAAAGPWVAIAATPAEADASETYSVVAGREREECNSIEEALARAARYNRSIANRAKPADEPVSIAVEANADTNAGTPAAEEAPANATTE
jgi:hypothetical protein